MWAAAEVIAIRATGKTPPKPTPLKVTQKVSVSRYRTPDGEILIPVPGFEKKTLVCCGVYNIELGYTVNRVWVSASWLINACKSEPGGVLNVW